MAATPQQRRAAIIALTLMASAGGGYVAKGDLHAIGQKFCGPVPRAVLVQLDHQGRSLPVVEATPQNIAAVQQAGAPAMIRLEVGQAQGLMAYWCNPDRNQLEDALDTKLVKGVTP